MRNLSNISAIAFAVALSACSPGPQDMNNVDAPASAASTPPPLELPAVSNPQGIRKIETAPAKDARIPGLKFDEYGQLIDQERAPAPVSQSKAAP